MIKYAFRTKITKLYLLIIFKTNSNPNQYSKGSYGSMFKSNNNYGGMSETNPGGNPFRQGGNKAGVSMAFNNKVYNGT